MPPYALFSNEQLAAMVTQRVSTRADLRAIAGVGEARLEKYADEFLQELARLWASDSANGNDGEKDAD